MNTSPRGLLFFLVFTLGAGLLPACGQVVIATIPVGTVHTYSPAEAVNPVTNRIYVTTCNDDPLCGSDAGIAVIDGVTNTATIIPVGGYVWDIGINSVTNKIYLPVSDSVVVLDGATNQTITVPVDLVPDAVAVNAVTNKIYVANYCGVDPDCTDSPGTVTIIDGATNQTTRVQVGIAPSAVAINPVTNRIYVMNNNCTEDPRDCPLEGSVTVIDGATSNVLATVDVQYLPVAVAVNPVTNKIYVVNTNCQDNPQCAQGSVTVIDGTTNTSTTVWVGFNPRDVAIDDATNKIYVPNVCPQSDCNYFGPGTVTVINGADNSTSDVTVGYVPFTATVDAATDKIYVINDCTSDVCVRGNISIIDGLSQSVTSVSAGTRPGAIAVNAITNRSYIMDTEDSTVYVLNNTPTTAVPR